MSQPRQSRALIIVNTHFRSGGSGGAPGTRRGARREAEKLSKVLSRLNYEVTLTHNKTAQEIEDLYQQALGLKDSGNGSCSAPRDRLQAQPAGGVGPQEPPKSPRALGLPRGEREQGGSRQPRRPQACRGEELDRGVVVECDSAEPEPDCFSHYLCIPPQTAVMFACSPGYVAFLNIFGSMFLQALLNVLEGEERHLALNRLLTRINWWVAFGCQARGTYEGCKEMPCFVTNLLQDVFPFSA
ncbi:CASP3 protein, partial [Psophia crepitans]|nr:CASP3 protein [Psophia crepitans]